MIRPAPKTTRPEVARPAKAQNPSPKPLLDKLGVKPEHRVSVVGIDDAGFLRDLERRASRVTRGRVVNGAALVFLGVRRLADLEKLGKLESCIPRHGAIWAVWTKGLQELSGNHVRAAAIRAGLVDVKVVSFSPTHTALKLVIPLARR